MYNIVEKLAELIKKAYTASLETKVDIKTMHEFFVGIFRSFCRIKTGGDLDSNLLTNLMSHIDCNNNFEFIKFIRDTMMYKSYIED
jgi:hypothetical protein